MVIIKGIIVKKVVVALSLLLSSQLHAAENNAVENVNEPDAQWQWSLAINSHAFDDSVAFEGIDDSAIGFSAHIDYIKNSWLTTVSAEYVSYDDNNEFSQDVVGSGFTNRGDVSRESSDASGFLLGVALGKIYYVGNEQDVAVFGQVGVDVMTASERSISLCDDCHSEDIDVDGGVYLRAGVTKDTGYFNLGFHAKAYVTGDSLNTAFGISAGSTF